jgi:class 3 adenylate cyclase
MFTDIVGSTEQAIARGDREWRELLDHHDSLVKQQLERFRGRLLRSTGDGILAIFDGPARAIQCAVAIRNGVNNLGISIRTGLHTGEVQARGDNVDGIAFHIGARVSALAEGGEVLVSSTVKDLVAGSGLLFTDRGSHGLKGLPGEWRVFAVKAAA